MRIQGCGDADCYNGPLIERLAKALEPFAAFADPQGKIRREHEITQGSRLAKKQLTMGDCYFAAQVLAELKVI